MSIRLSLFASFLDRYSGLVIMVVSSMIVARLLTPSEIGVYSVAMVLLSFASTVRDLGAGQYLIQEKELTEERIRAVWTVQLGLGLGLAVLVCLLSQPVASFYAEPMLRDIMLIVALNYAINPVGSLTHAWLMREMRFGATAIIRFSGNLLGAIVTCLLAWRGHGAISLAWGAVTVTVVGALISAYYRPRHFPWLPGLKGLGRVLSFGTPLTASSIINTAYKGAPELFLGKFQTMTDTGLYSRAGGLVQIFQRLVVDAVGSVCLPWFSKQLREQTGIAQPLLKATSYICATGWAFCTAAALLADPIIRLLYGQQWVDAVPMVRLLALALAFSVPTFLCQTALLSSGAVGQMAKGTLLCAIVGVLLAALGSAVSMHALGWALVATAVFAAGVWVWITSRVVGIGPRDWIEPLWRSAAVAALATPGPALAVWIWGLSPQHVLPPLLLGGGAAAAGFVAGVFAFKHPLAAELQLVGRKLLRR